MPTKQSSSHDILMCEVQVLTSVPAMPRAFTHLLSEVSNKPVARNQVIPTGILWDLSSASLLMSHARLEEICMSL